MLLLSLKDESCLNTYSRFKDKAALRQRNMVSAISFSNERKSPRNLLNVSFVEHFATLLRHRRVKTRRGVKIRKVGPREWSPLKGSAGYKRNGEETLRYRKPRVIAVAISVAVRPLGTSL